MCVCVCVNSTETESKSARRLSDRDQAMGWALATFFRQQGITKTTGGSGGGGGSSLDRVQSFIMKDKKGMLKLPRAAKAKVRSGWRSGVKVVVLPPCRCDLVCLCVLLSV